MNNKELLNAIALMIQTRNWQGYLYLRRQFISQFPNGMGDIRHLLKSLPQADIEAYKAYFGSGELPKKHKVVYQKPATTNKNLPKLQHKPHTLKVYDFRDRS